eukprot:g4817.t1
MQTDVSTQDTKFDAAAASFMKFENALEECHSSITKMQESWRSVVWDSIGVAERFGDSCFLDSARGSESGMAFREAQESIANSAKLVDDAMESATRSLSHKLKLHQAVQTIMKEREKLKSEYDYYFSKVLRLRRNNGTDPKKMKKAEGKRDSLKEMLSSTSNELHKTFSEWANDKGNLVAEERTAVILGQLKFFERSASLLRPLAVEPTNTKPRTNGKAKVVLKTKSVVQRAASRSSLRVSISRKNSSAKNISRLAEIDDEKPNFSPRVPPRRSPKLSNGRQSPKVPARSLPTVPARMSPKIPARSLPKVPARMSPRIPARMSPRIPARKSPITPKREIVPPRVKETTIDFAGNMRCTDADIIKQAERCGENLQTVNLNSCIATTDESLLYISNCGGRISHIDVSKCKMLTSSGISSLLAAAGRNLKVFVASECNLTDEALCSLGVHCPSLQQLRISSSLITDEGLRAVMCKDLRSIDIGKCRKVTDSGLVSLVENCPNLEEIQLQQCKMTNFGITTLAFACRNAKVIGLKQNGKIGDDGIKAIAEGCSQLTHLNIQGCRLVTDVTPLATGCPNLVNLNLKGLYKVKKDDVMKAGFSCQIDY